MDEYVEPRVRRVVAEHLGVDSDELTRDVSLVDDLAADSLDLIEVGLAVENELGIVIPERALEEVRTFGELVDAALTLAREHRHVDARREMPPVAVVARIVPPLGERGQRLERAVVLTPYEAQTIIEDALRAGRGARLELVIPRNTTDAGIAAVQREFATLTARGILVNVRRDRPASARRTQSHAAA